MPSGQRFLIPGLWVVGIALGVLTGTGPVISGFGRNPSWDVLILMLGLPVVFFPVVAFWIRGSPFYSPRVAKLVDERFGAGTLEAFLVRLRPMLLFGAVAVVQGLTAMSLMPPSDRSMGAYAVCGFFLSAGVGFALAHSVLYFRKVPGVYPSRADVAPPPEAAEPRRMPLGEALRAYWWTMLGLLLFPTIAMVGMNIFHVPFGYLLLLFFAAALLAAWPYGSGRAPFSFWIVASVVYVFGGTLLSILLFETYRALFR